MQVGQALTLYRSFRPPVLRYSLLNHNSRLPGMAVLGRLAVLDSTTVNPVSCSMIYACLRLSLPSHFPYDEQTHIAKTGHTTNVHLQRTTHTCNSGFGERTHRGGIL